MDPTKTDFNGLQQAFRGTPQENPGGSQTAGQGGAGGNPGYEELEDGRVVLSREDFEEYQKGYLRQQDYTVKTQAVAEDRKKIETARGMLNTVIEQYNAAVRAGQLTPEQAAAAGKRIEQGVSDLNKGEIPPAIQEILMRQDARFELMELEKEAAQLRQTYPHMDDTMYQAVVKKTLEMQEAAGPQSKLRIPLEEAYFILTGKDREQSLAAVQKRQEESARKKEWRSPASGAGFVRPKGEKPAETWEQARAQSERYLAEFLGE